MVNRRANDRGRGLRRSARGGGGQRCPTVLAPHVFGASDPEGFAAVGVVETLVHTYGTAQGLRRNGNPPEDLSRRARVPLFPDVPIIDDATVGHRTHQQSPAAPAHELALVRRTSSASMTHMSRGDRLQTPGPARLSR
jgi:hypothetical protein